MEPEHPFDSFRSRVVTEEIGAALAMGRFDGSLEHATAPALRIFAARILRDTITASLRQEGHEFTDDRYHAWFAGLATLNDTQPRHTRPPRVVCEAILVELSHCRWIPLAEAAIRIRPAFLAPNDLEADEAHARVHKAIADARLLVERLRVKSFPQPFALLEALHEEVLRSVLFAPPQPGVFPMPPAIRRTPIEQQPDASPRWAIELAFADCLQVAGWLRTALPLIGLLRPDALRPTAAIARADALREAMERLHKNLGEATSLAQRSHLRAPGRRKTSRAPELFELLAGFGPMRSAQMETVLGVTRLGIRGILAALDGEGLIERRTIAGSHLYAVTPGRIGDRAASERLGEGAFSTDALDEFGSSMARLDDLLARHSAQTDGAEE
ncbi:MAG TPA: hypothetical protein VMQ93_10360 [Novosphingobium sp.]|nr:hypothetical protein [Novosphingobium sp.]